MATPETCRRVSQLAAEIPGVRLYAGGTGQRCLAQPGAWRATSHVCTVHGSVDLTLPVTAWHAGPQPPARGSHGVGGRCHALGLSLLAALYVQLGDAEVCRVHAPVTLDWEHVQGLYVTLERLHVTAYLWILFCCFSLRVAPLICRQ